MSSTSQPDPSVIQSLDRFSAAVQEQVETDVAGHAALKKIRREHAQFHHLETRVLSSLCGPLLLQLRAAKVDDASQIKALEARWHELMARGPPFGRRSRAACGCASPSLTSRRARACRCARRWARSSTRWAATTRRRRSIARRRARSRGRRRGCSGCTSTCTSVRRTEGIAAGGDHAGARVPRGARALPGEGARASGWASGVPVGRWLHAALAPLSKALRLNPTSERCGRWRPTRITSSPARTSRRWRRGRRDAARDGAAPVGRRPVHQPGEGAQRGGRPRRGARRLPPRRAARPSWRHAYLVSESLLTGGRHAEARESYARLVRRPDAAGRPELADAYNHLAVSILGASDEEGRPRGGVWRVARPGRGVLRVGRGDRAEPGVHGAPRAQLLPGGRLALPPRGQLDYATAALWPVSAGDDTPRAASDGRRRLPRPRVGPRARRAAGGGARRARGEPPPPHADGRLERGRRRAARARRARARAAAAAGRRPRGGPRRRAGGGASPA